MNFADGFGLGRVCLVLGTILMIWGACREPMMPTRPQPVMMPPNEPIAASVPGRALSPSLDDGEKEHVPVIVRRDGGKTGR